MPAPTTPNPEPAVPPPAPASPPNPEPPTPPPAGVEPPAADTPPEAKFTQTDLDRFIGQAKRDGKGAERAALLKELGVESVEAAQAILRAADDAKKAQMTETDRLRAEKESAEKVAQEAKAAADKATAEAQAALLKAAVISKASGRFANPEAAYKLADLSGIKPDENSSDKFTGIDEALNALAKAEPWTVAQNRPTVPSLGPSNPPGNPQTRTDEQRRQDYFQGGAGNDFFDKKQGGVVLPS